MTTQEVANKLVEYCRTGQWDQAQAELFAEDAVSIEPEGGAWPVMVKGKAAIKDKGDQFNSMVEEFYGSTVSEPLVFADQFSVGMTMDLKFKGAERSKNSEICVFEVRNGKITKEQFFYPVNG